MKVETHKELRAGMLCIIAFTLGCMIAFCGGCSTAGKTQTRVFDKQGCIYKKPSQIGSSHFLAPTGGACWSAGRGLL